MKLYRLAKVSTVIAALIVASLACSNATPNTTKPEDAPVVQEDEVEEILESYDEKTTEFAESLNSGEEGTLSLTEEELTAIFIDAVNKAQADGQNIPLSELAITVEAGQITTYAVASAGPLSANGAIVTIPYINESGTLSLDLVSVAFGPVELGENLIGGLLTDVEETIDGMLVDAFVDVELISIDAESDEVILTAVKD